MDAAVTTKLFNGLIPSVPLAMPPSPLQYHERVCELWTYLPEQYESCGIRIKTIHIHLGSEWSKKNIPNNEAVRSHTLEDRCRVIYVTFIVKILILVTNCLRSRNPRKL